MIKTIFFDFDGVIVESLDIKTSAFRKLFLAEGDSVADAVAAYHEAHTGVSRFDKFKYIYREILRRPLDENTFAMLCNKFSELVMEEVIQAPYVAGALEFLTHYACQYRCVIVSATPQPEIETILSRRGIGNFFQRVFGAPTPKKDAVQKFLAATGTLPEEAVYIGDAPSDYEAAQDNHIHFIARIKQNEWFFRTVECPGIPDLVKLADVIRSLP